MAKEQPKSERQLSTQNGTEYAYHVQFRAPPQSQSRTLVKIGNYYATHFWQTLEIPEDNKGVPSHVWNAIAREQHMLSFDAAHALMAWAAATVFPNAVEFRLQKVVLRYSYSIHEVGVSDVFNFMLDEHKFEWKSSDNA